MPCSILSLFDLYRFMSFFTSFSERRPIAAAHFSAVASDSSAPPD